MEHAAQLLNYNKEELKNKYAEYIVTNYPYRTQDFNKCARDIDLVLSAYYNDLMYSTDMQTKFITSRFFKNNILQLKSTDVELDVHQKLLQDIKVIFLANNESQAASKVEELANIFLEALHNGKFEPEPQNLITDVLTNRVTCRSFSQQPIELDKVRVILSALERSPSKQNRMPIEITVLGPNAIAEKESIYLESHCGPDFPHLYNPQLLAPLVFLFSKRDSQKLYPGDDTVSRDLNPNNYAYVKNCNIQIGICTTIICLAAESLGLQTGYCFSVDQGNTGPMMLGTKNIEFGFGVGYARDDVSDIRYRTKPLEDSSASVKTISETGVYFNDWVNFVGF
jgi:hypothetical protein